MQLAPPILAEKVSCAPVLVIVLQRNQGVEHRDDLAADDADLRRWDHEDEVVAADVPHEPAGIQHPLDHIVQDARQQVDDPVAVVVAVPVVELLEVVEIRVTDRELALCSSWRRISRSISVVPGSRVDGCTDTSRSVRTSIASRRERCSAGENSPVITSSVPAENQLCTSSRIVPAREHHRGNDRGERVALECANQVHAASPRPVCVHEEEAGEAAQYDGLNVRRVGKNLERKVLDLGPMPNEVRNRSASGEW